MANDAVALNDLLVKFTNPDPDIRFMALTDLNSLLAKDFDFRDSEVKVTDQVLALLFDQNSEVQNNSSKSLVLLSAKINNLSYLCDSLLKRMQVKDQNDVSLSQNDICLLTLSRIIDNVKPALFQPLLSLILPKLLIQLKDPKFNVDLVDLLVIIYKKFTSCLDDDLQSVSVACLLDLFTHKRAIVRSRTINAIGAFAKNCKESNFKILAKTLSSQLLKLSENNHEELQSYLSALSALW
jgi:hypothetical protein